MKLKKWALVAEIFGGIAIVLSLIFVAVEVQQSTRAQNAATTQEVYRDLRAMVTAIPDEIRYASRFEGETLTDEARSEYIQWLTIAFRAFESWYELHELGAISDEMFDSYMTYVEVTFRDPYAREYWQEFARGSYSPGYADFVESHLDSTPLP